MINADAFECIQISRSENFASQFGNIVNEIECNMPQNEFDASFWLQVAAAVATVSTVFVAAYQARQAKKAADKAQKFVESESKKESLRDAALVAAWEDPAIMLSLKGKAKSPATAPSIGIENNSPTPIFNIEIEHASLEGGVHKIKMLMPGEDEWHDLTDLKDDYVYHDTSQPLVFRFENHLGEKFKRDATNGWRVVRTE